MNTFPANRAVLLLQRERIMLEKERLWGITAKPIDDNWYHWEATIRGLNETPWEGGVFKLELHFNENYDMKPPLVHFVTVPFHPNIDMETGKPCMEFLDDPTCWIPSSYSIRTILIHLQVLLASPTFSSPPVNVKAYNTLINSTRLYNQLAMDCVVASRRVEAGLSPYHINEEKVQAEEPPEDEEFTVTGEEEKLRPKIKPVSFAHYYEAWKKMASSKPAEPVKTLFKVSATPAEQQRKRQNGPHPGNQMLSKEQNDQLISKLLKEPIHHLIDERDQLRQKEETEKKRMERISRIAAAFDLADSSLENRLIPLTGGVEEKESAFKLDNNFLMKGNDSQPLGKLKQSGSGLMNPESEAAMEDTSDAWELEADNLVNWTKELELKS